MLAEGAQRRFLLGAELLGSRAAGAEPAAGRRVDRRRQFAGHALVLTAALQAFRKQRDQLLALLGDLPDEGWSQSATVLGGGRPLEITVHSYADRLARHERTHWRQVAKTVSALLD